MFRTDEARDAPRCASALRRCTCGAVSTEYLVVLVVAALTFVAALGAIAPGMVASWSQSRAVLYGASP